VQQRQLSMRSSTSCRDTLEVSGPPDRRFYVRIMPVMGGLLLRDGARYLWVRLDHPVLRERISLHRCEWPANDQPGSESLFVPERIKRTPTAITGAGTNIRFVTAAPTP